MPSTLFHSVSLRSRCGQNYLKLRLRSNMYMCCSLLLIFKLFKASLLDRSSFNAIYNLGYSILFFTLMRNSAQRKLSDLYIYRIRLYFKLLHIK